jgi:hypothetical protein
VAHGAADHLPRHLLFRVLAYRLQAERFGHLDKDTERFLDRVASGVQAGGEIKTWTVIPPAMGFNPEPFWSGNGMVYSSGSWSSKSTSPGTARPIAA